MSNVVPQAGEQEQASVLAPDLVLKQFVEMAEAEGRDPIAKELVDALLHALLDLSSAEHPENRRSGLDQQRVGERPDIAPPRPP